MANSFNLWGKLWRLFGLLNDAKIGSGPCARPGSLLRKDASNTTENGDIPDQVMASADAEIVEGGHSSVQPAIHHQSGYFTAQGSALYSTPTKHKVPDASPNNQEGFVEVGKTQQRRLK